MSNKAPPKFKVGDEIYISPEAVKWTDIDGEYGDKIHIIYEVLSTSRGHWYRVGFDGSPSWALENYVTPSALSLSPLYQELK